MEIIKSYPQHKIECELLFTDFSWGIFIVDYLYKYDIIRLNLDI